MSQTQTTSPKTLNKRGHGYTSRARSANQPSKQKQKTVDCNLVKMTKLCYSCNGVNHHSLWKWKWSDIRPSMVTHTRNLCSAINPSKVHTHTHTVNTHPEQWAAIYAVAPGEQLGVQCLAQGHLSRGIEGGESAVHSLPPPTIPAGPRLKLATFGWRVRLSNH